AALSVSSAGRGGAAAGAAEQPPRVLDIAPDLRHERVRVRKAALAAQPLDEAEPRAAAVQVAVEVQDVHLDAEPAGVVEGGVGADAGRADPPRRVSFELDPHRVDA